MHEPSWKGRMLNHIPYVGRLRNGWLAKSHEIQLLRESMVQLTESPFQPYGISLDRARREVTDLAPVGEYTNLYRAEEPLYWLHIPAWVSEWSVLAKPQRILDIGSGYGSLAVFSAIETGAKVFCLDWEPHRLAETLVKRHGLEVAGGNVELMDIPWQEPMDAILMTEIIEHFNFHPVPTMQKVCRAIRPGGRLFLSTPDSDSWGRVTDLYDDYRAMPYPDPRLALVDRHVYQFTEAELVSVLTESGFEIVRLARAPGRWGLHLNVEATTGS